MLSFKDKFFGFMLSLNIGLSLVFKIQEQDLKLIIKVKFNTKIQY
jgi:hypothetical protein